jgi:hypothetical protein
MESPTTILNFVRHIQVPANHSFLGIHPILSMCFQTDDTTVISEMLKKCVADKSYKDILDRVNYCVSSSIYPHKSTVWLFNDCRNDVLVLEEFFNGRSYDILDCLKLYEDTYPFIATDLHYTEEPLENKYLPLKKAEPHSRSNPSRTMLTPTKNKSVVEHRSQPSFLVPTVALGSLYVLSKLATEKG